MRLSDRFCEQIEAHLDTAATLAGLGAVEYEIVIGLQQHPGGPQYGPVFATTLFFMCDSPLVGGERIVAFLPCFVGQLELPGGIDSAVDEGIRQLAEAKAQTLGMPVAPPPAGLILPGQ